MTQLHATEAQIQQDIIRYLVLKGFYVQRMNSGAIRDRANRLVRMNRAGTPDIMAFRELKERITVVDASKNLKAEVNVPVPRTQLLFIEVKRPGNIATALQNAVMREMEEHGATCIVATSIEDIEEVIRI